MSPRPYRTRLDVRRMRVLREVAAQGSITGAADALSFSPSAVSQQIRVLEAEAGVTLIERLPRCVRLTTAGEALVGHTEFILARLEQAEEEIRQIAGLRGGRLRLATFRTAGETLVAEALTYFRNRFPEVELSLIEGEPEDYIPLLRSNEIDVALTFEYDHIPFGRDESVDRVPLCSDPIRIALGRDHPLAANDEVALEELADDSWISSTPNIAVHRFTERACASAGFEPQIAFETDDYHVAQSFVAGGLGVAFLPLMAARSLHPEVVLRPIRGGSLARRILAVHRTGGDRSPSVAAMLEVLRDLGGEFDRSV